MPKKISQPKKKPTLKVLFAAVEESLKDFHEENGKVWATLATFEELKSRLDAFHKKAKMGSAGYGHSH